MSKPLHHHYRSFWKRGWHALILVSIVMAVGTLTLRWLEHWSLLDSFYFMSMLATAQGSAVTPATAAGKLFAALFAFISVGSVLTALGFLFGPFLGQVWHFEVEHLQPKNSNNK